MLRYFSTGIALVDRPARAHPLILSLESKRKVVFWPFFDILVPVSDEISSFYFLGTKKENPAAPSIEELSMNRFRQGECDPRGRLESAATRL